MAEKTKAISREQQYKTILAEKEININNCIFLRFEFNSEKKGPLFHYAVMESHVKYHLFDFWNKNSVVIVPKDQEIVQTITELALLLGGKEAKV